MLSTQNDSTFDVKRTLEQFLETRTSKFTRRNYERQIREVLGDPLAFLTLASQDPREAKFRIVDWITSRKQEVSSSTLRTYLVSVKSLLDYAEITLPWKSIVATTGRPPTADIKAPSHEAAKKAYELADLRTRVIIGINLAGPRVGAYDWLRRRDLTEITAGGVTIGRIVIYRGEPEQYVSFLTPETLANIQSYLELRQRVKEEIGPDSPLVRTKFDPFPRKSARRGPRKIKAIQSASVQKILGDLWDRAGYPSATRDWALAHGFRKYAETRLVNAGMKWEDAELILGHKLRYYKADEKYLASQFVKFMHSLYMTDAPQLKAKISEIEKEKEEIKTEYYLKWRMTEDKLAQTEQKNSESMNVLIQELKAQRERLEKIERAARAQDPSETSV